MARKATSSARTGGLDSSEFLLWARSLRVATLFKKGLTENLLKKGFIEKTEHRRDQPAQRLRVNGCVQYFRFFPQL